MQGQEGQRQVTEGREAQASGSWAETSTPRGLPQVPPAQESKAGPQAGRAGAGRFLLRAPGWQQAGRLPPVGNQVRESGPGLPAGVSAPPGKGSAQGSNPSRRDKWEPSLVPSVAPQLPKLLTN